MYDVGRWISGAFIGLQAAVGTTGKDFPAL